MHTKQQLLEMHSEHTEWQNKIKFYKDELKQLDEKLGEMIGKNSPTSVLAEAEHFQNQFILQKEVLDIMRHDFKQHENKLEALQKSPEHVTTLIEDMHTTQRERLVSFEKIFHDLRTEFGDFQKKSESMAL